LLQRHPGCSSGRATDARIEGRADGIRHVREAIRDHRAGAEHSERLEADEAWDQQRFGAVAEGARKLIDADETRFT
jgi:hypothetical protein